MTIGYKYMDKNIAIRLTDLSKIYEIKHDKPTLLEKLTMKKHETFWALNDINLTIKKGERVGIIGPNGGGKTLLLKMIAGITSPTSGKVESNGKIVSLIDLEAGFHPYLTGIQNIFLNATLLGLAKKDIENLLPEIIDFADIKQFIDVQLYTYSAGMALRLGFSIAIHSNPDILILDEGLSIGDSNFQKKSQDKLREFFQEGKTILIVSHWPDYIIRNCSRAIIMREGRIIKDGTPTLIMKKYQNPSILKQ